MNDSIRHILENEFQEPYDPLAKKGRRTGYFTLKERTILEQTIDAYFKKRGWTQTDGWKRLSSRARDSWEEIAAALPGRKRISVQRYALRRLNPWKRGKWSSNEEKLLLELVKVSGRKWAAMAEEHLRREPNLIKAKAHALEGRLQLVLNSKEPLEVLLKDCTTYGAVIGKSHNQIWNNELDAKLLAGIYLVTGVRMPCRGVPWVGVVEHMPPGITESCAAARYKRVLFPNILRVKFGGPHRATLLRQTVRYIYRVVEAKLVEDLSEVEPHRIIPFWYGNALELFRAYLRRGCPASVQKMPFSEKIQWLYKYLQCETTEEYDLQRLANAFDALQKVNGVILLPAGRKRLSEKWDKELPEAEAVIPRPRHASEEVLKKVVPKHLQHVPEAFAQYYAKLKKKPEIEKFAKIIDSDSLAQSEWLSYQLLDGLGVEFTPTTTLPPTEAFAVIRDPKFWGKVDSADAAILLSSEQTTQDTVKVDPILDGRLTVKNHPWIAG